MRREMEAGFYAFIFNLCYYRDTCVGGIVAGCAVQKATHMHSAGVRASEQLDSFRHWNSWYRMDVELARTPPAPSPNVWLPLLQFLVEELEGEALGPHQVGQHHRHTAGHTMLTAGGEREGGGGRGGGGRGGGEGGERGRRERKEMEGGKEQG